MFLMTYKFFFLTVETLYPYKIKIVVVMTYLENILMSLLCN